MQGLAFHTGKKMKKRILSLLLVGCMVGTMLAGCGNSGSAATDKAETTETSEVTTQEGTPAQKEGEYPVLKLNYAAIFSKADEAMVEDALNEIFRETCGAEIDLVGIEFANWTTQLNLMLTGGEDSLDIFTSFWYTSESNLVANGQVAALDDLIETYGQDILDQFEDKAYLNCAQVDGKLYGIPSVTAWCNSNMYLARTDVVESSGIDFDKIKDMDTLTEAMIQMKETNPDEYFIPGSTDTYWVPKSIDYLGDTNLLGVLLDPAKSTTVENYYESDYFIEFLDYVQVWKDNNLISPDPLSNSDPTLANLQNGIVAGTPGYNYDAKIGALNSGAQFGLDLMGTELTDSYATTGDVTTYLWHISSFCKYPEEAMKVLNQFYSNPDVAQIIANGIKGVHYNINEEGQMEYPEGKAAMDLGWNVGSGYYWPNSTLCKTWNYEPANVYEVMKEKNAKAIKSLALGFQFDSSELTNEITACRNVISQYYMPLIYAEVNREEVLPVFQQALKDAGIEKIIKEKQSQLDEWLTRQ